MRLHVLLVRGRIAVGGEMFENLAHWARDGGHIRLAQARCRFDQCIEHRLQIESRAADDLEHVGGRGLLRQRFVQLARTRFEFLLQLRSGFANAVNVSSRLRFVRTKTGVSSGLCPFSSQDHLVGTVTGSPSGRASQRSSLSILPEPHDELALHSITSSARASSVGGTCRPSAFAVFRLITSSYLVGACTGRSAGFSPLRIRSTYWAAERNWLTRSDPYEI